MHKTDKTIAFASELKSFLYLYIYEKNIDYNYIGEVVQNIQFVEVLKNTYLKNVFRLLPGENLFVDKFNKIKIKKYWNINKDIKFFDSDKNRNNKDVYNELENLIIESCKLRNRSDVPLSVSLSGGLDSSIILKNLISINKDKINAFYLRYLESEHNEDEYIDTLKNKLKFNLFTSNFKYSLSFQEVKDHILVLDDVYYHLLIGPYENYKSIKSKNFKISLDGQGADELFCGYTQCINDYIINSNNIFSLIKKYINFKNIILNLNKGTYSYNYNLLTYFLRYFNHKYNKIIKNLLYITFLINKILFLSKIKFFSYKIFTKALLIIKKLI